MHTWQDKKMGVNSFWHKQGKLVKVEQYTKMARSLLVCLGLFYKVRA